MDKYIERTYIEEVITQANFASGALGRINDCIKALENREVGTEERRFVSSEIFRNIHSFLTHAAVVSKILFPAKNKKKPDRVVRGEHLRELLEVDGGHPIMTRSVRDDLDHFDERIDQWATDSKKHNRLDKIIGPRNIIGGTIFEEGDTFRHYVPGEGVFMFRGKEIDIGKIAKALGELRDRCEKVRVSGSAWHQGDKY